MSGADFYFAPFESRQPPEPLPYSPGRELLWQFLATITLMLGGWYIWWRWTASLNYSALWFAVPLVVAETGAFIGLILFVINLWKDQDTGIPAAPALLSDCVGEPVAREGNISVDVFFATYNEDPELVRLGLRDAKLIEYPFPINIHIHVLDDGRREVMRTVAAEEGANYITRANNVGYKAGNLRNAMEVTSGDFLVICDADTRPFPTILSRTLGYFRDPQVAWVQTPQWFYDIPEGARLQDAMAKKFGKGGALLGSLVERILGPVRLGADPFVNDPKMFYDIILRRRNWSNAAFCCGAGSIHRREAVMEAALRTYAKAVESEVDDTLREWSKEIGEHPSDPHFIQAMRSQAIVSQELAPYKFHVSEDIYTSIVLHSDRERGWKSVLHPFVESKMLSPQDLLSWTVQRFKYAGGTLDIMYNDNPLARGGLTVPQKLMYGATFWSYLGALWNVVFLAAPIVYFFTGTSPVAAYSATFFLHILPFLLCLELAIMVGTWGVPGYQSQSSYIAFFPVNLRALWTVLKGKKISFPVTPKDRQAGRHTHLVYPQLSIVVLTMLAMLFGWATYALNFGTHSLVGLVANTLWGINNLLALSGVIRAAYWEPETPKL